LDEGVRVINTFCEKIIILDFVSGDNFFPRVLIYPNTFIQGQYVYIVENTPNIAPNPCFVIMDPSVPSLKKKREKNRVVSEIYGNHSNEVNPPLKL
jgi:hypothetical protein